MVDVRRSLASLFAVAAIGLSALASFAVKTERPRSKTTRLPLTLSEPKASNFRSVAIAAEIDNQTTETTSSDKVTSDRELPKQWLILGIALATIVAMVMLFILFKPVKISERSDRDSESSET